MSTLHASRSAIVLAANPTLARLLDHVLANPTLTARQRQDTSSAIRTVAKALGRPPDEVSAHPADLRLRLKGFAPAMAGLTKTRWRNALSLLRGALQAAGITWTAARSRAPLAPAWTALIHLFDGTHEAIALSRLARYCSGHGIAPADVNNAVFADFSRDLAEGGLIEQPHKVLQRAAVVWNQAAAGRPGWPGRTLTVPDQRRSYILPWSVFPPTLQADVQAYLDHLAGKDILEELDFRPLKPCSIQTHLYRLRAYLAALVHRGHDPQTLGRLSDVVALPMLKDGLRFFLDRDPAGSTSRAYDITTTLVPMASHWVKMDADYLKALRATAKRLQPRRTGMTETNQDRLRPFDDPATARKLLALPATLLADLAGKRPPRAHARRALTDKPPTMAKLLADLAGKTPTAAAALSVQTALAIELLLMMPIRLKNLTHLELGRHLIRSGKGLQLAIPGELVKNGVAVEAGLPLRTALLLDLYVTRYRPLLTQASSAWLFPGRSPERPKCDRQLRTQISTTAKRRCGLVVNPHLFRHIAATLYLKTHPGAYGVIRLLLGHKSINTTTRFYCGTETAVEVRHFDAFILGLGDTPEDDR